jgi:DNA-binding winged helix-turn-helix (wHTH) protein
MKTGNLFKFGQFEVDALARTVRRQEVTLTLNRRAFDVLLYFVRNPGRVLSKDELLKSVWPDASVDENSLMQSISVLRRALDEKPGENRCIVTLPGRGYQFISTVQVVVTEDPSPAQAAATAGTDGAARLVSRERTIRTSVITEEREDPAPPKYANWLRIALALVLALVVASGAGYFAWRHFQPLPPSTMVVLADFENTTGDPDFDRVLNRALLIDLEQSPFLNLLSPSKVQGTLTEMRRQRDEALTPALPGRSVSATMGRRCSTARFRSSEAAICCWWTPKVASAGSGSGATRLKSIPRKRSWARWTRQPAGCASSWVNRALPANASRCPLRRPRRLRSTRCEPTARPWTV